ncbi:hypothetical protein D1647_23480 [Alistipes sp. Z76]|nr:hypothetical protein [Alistipes sp. Z76]NCE71104.1 hypothetical protein [Muribaculaceae bacterium M3]
MTAKTSANRLEIIYDEGADLYNMRFFRISIHHAPFDIKVKDIKILMVSIVICWKIFSLM